MLRKFILRCLIVILPVPLLLLLFYVVMDPFMAVRDYDMYPGSSIIRPGINKGMVSLRNFDRYNDSVGYNSFILGSSVSIPYKCEVWEQYLPPEAKTFHFDAALESIHSLRLKIEYLMRHARSVDNVIIVVPPTWFGFEQSESPVFIDHYKINTDVSFIDYHWTFISNFYDREFIKSYLYSLFTGKPSRVGLIPAIDTQPIHISAVHNEETIPLWDDSIRHCPVLFYEKRKEFKAQRVPHQSPFKMTAAQELELRAISELLDGVDYNIVVGPMLSKEYMDSVSAVKMRDIFGARFRDFSRSMQWVADIDTCFYDNIHYRAPVASMILDSIYALSDLSPHEALPE